MNGGRTIHARAHELVAGQDGLEEALALEEGSVEEPLPVEPEEVDGDEVDRVVVADAVLAEILGELLAPSGGGPGR